MRNKHIITVILVIVAMGVTIATNYFINNRQLEKKCAWIDISKVYQEFKMKKELEKDVQVVESARKHILDSLELGLKMIANQFEALSDKEKDVMAQQFQQKKQEYLTRQQEFGEDNEQLRSNYNQQVLKQINQYVKDFALQEDYYMVLGAEGSGALMYAKETSDITEEMIKFINNKYEGTK